MIAPKSAYSAGSSRPQIQEGDTIVVGTYGLSPGGAERQWLYLARGLKEIGFKVVFVTYCRLEGDSGHYVQMLADLGIELIDCSTLGEINVMPDLANSIADLKKNFRIPDYYVRDFFRLSAVLNQVAPIGVFAQLDDPNILFGFTSLLCGIPRVVLSFRNHNPTHFSWIYRDHFLSCYQALAKSHAVRFTGNSRTASGDYADWLGIAHERVSIIPNAVDPDLFPIPADFEVERLRCSLGIPKESPVILGVFRLYPEKAPDIFLQTVCRLAMEFPELRTLIVGIGPMRQALEKFVSELGLHRHVQFLGRREDVNVLMALADVLLHTSRKEGMPNVVTEAQLMGTPVVATALPEISEIVREHETAKLCPIGDVEDFTNACAVLLRDKARAAAMGAAGRRNVLAFPASTMARAYVDAANLDW